MSRQVQTESAYVQTVPDSKCLCPDRPRRKVDMSRLSCVQNFSCVLRAFEDKYVQTITDRNSICPDFRAFLSRPSCTPSSCVRRQICPDHPRPKQYMSRLSCVHVQTIVRLCPDHPAFKSRPSCVHVQTFVRSPDRKKITSWGAVLFLEDEDREGSKIPQIHMFKVYQKI